jgi:alkylation response protein AidB-like acyl-CoA dehydrogenase
MEISLGVNRIGPDSRQHEQRFLSGTATNRITKEVTVTVTEISSPAEMVQDAGKLVPLLRSHAAWSEQNRRLHEETLEALTDAGVFRMRVPARFGGLESSASTVIDVLGEVAKGDGSAAWIAGVNAITTWMACLLPDEVQEEIFADPGVRLCGTLSPTGMCMPVDGGMVLTGKWSFISGALHSQWQVIIAVAPAPGPGVSFWPVMTVVPMSDLQIIDDWHTSGLRGSGSVTTVAQQVFIPQQRILPLPLVLAEQYASQANAASPIYRTPLLPTASALSVGTAVGLANAAKEEFLDRLAGRKITYTSYENQNEAPVTHLRVNEAAMLIDEAAFHAHRLGSRLDSKGEDGSPWTVADRGLARADMGRACELAKAAADILSLASGGSSIYTDVPIQRIVRDLHAINMHALMSPTTNAELYGRILCGMEPNTLYI